VDGSTIKDRFLLACSQPTACSPQGAQPKDPYDYLVLKLSLSFPTLLYLLIMPGK